MKKMPKAPMGKVEPILPKFSVPFFFCKKGEAKNQRNLMIIYPDVIMTIVKLK